MHCVADVANSLDHMAVSPAKGSGSKFANFIGGV